MTFIFSDIEASPKILSELSGRYLHLFEEQRRILRESFANHGGDDIRAEGTNLLAVFTDPVEAVVAAVEAQRQLSGRQAGEDEMRVKLAVHSGEAVPTPSGYVGLGLNETARVCAVTYGGQILISETTVALVAEQLPPDLELRGVGKHKLKDFTRPHALYQVCHDDLRQDFPPVGGRQIHLPPLRGKLAGRETEIDAVIEAVEREVVAVTLVGPPGVGKTRLAIESAGILGNRFSDGVWFVDLSTTARPEEVEETITAALQTNTEAGRREALAEYLASRKVLLLLDGFEQVIDAAPTVSGFLSGSPDSRVLITSTESLAISGEDVVIIDPLSQQDALTLFADRLGVPATDIAGRPDDDAAILSLCKELDGLPLAIELAALQARESSPQALYEELLSQPLSRISWMEPIYGLLERAYRLLSPNEALLLCRLSVFLQKFTFSDVETVCSGDKIEAWEVLELLDGLINKSWIRQAPESNSLYLLATIRRYAFGRLEIAGDAEELMARYREWVGTASE